MNGKKSMSKLHSHEVWIKLPDGPEFVAGKAWTLEQAQFIRAQLVSCAEKAGWRYVYTIRDMNGKKFDSDDYSRYYVHDYDSNSRLIGAPSRILIEESLDAGPTGAVLAYLGEDGLWHYVRPDIASSIHEEGLEVRTVYVYVDPV